MQRGEERREVLNYIKELKSVLSGMNLPGSGGKKDAFSALNDYLSGRTIVNGAAFGGYGSEYTKSELDTVFNLLEKLVVESQKKLSSATFGKFKKSDTLDGCSKMIGNLILAYLTTGFENEKVIYKYDQEGTVDKEASAKAVIGEMIERNNLNRSSPMARSREGSSSPKSTASSSAASTKDQKKLENRLAAMKKEESIENSLLSPRSSSSVSKAGMFKAPLFDDAVPAAKPDLPRGRPRGGGGPG